LPLGFVTLLTFGAVYDAAAYPERFPFGPRAFSGQVESGLPLRKMLSFKPFARILSARPVITFAEYALDRS
jgi:hypothetical protein